MPGSDDSERKKRIYPEIVSGTEIGHYRIDGEIGSGGMADVFLAEDTRLNRPVAIKILSRQYALDDTFKARFAREAQAIAKLDHPNIVTIYEVGEYKGIPFLAMQYVDGGSLKDRIASEDVSVEDVVRIAAEVANGLEHAHGHGIVHRDVKPANILMGSDGHAKLLDFGLASIEGDRTLTISGSAIGTPSYMSPEQVEGKRVDHRSDLFSLGAIIYEMITKRVLFGRESQMAVLNAVMHQAPEPLARYKTGVPEDLQAIVSKLLEKDPSMRYQTASDLLSDLKRLARSMGSGEYAISSSEIASPPRRLSGWRLTAAIGIGPVAVVLIIAVYLVTGGLGIVGDRQSPGSGDGRWKNSVAVLPFRDFSPNRELGYLCDGMTDAIISRLSTYENLKTISLTSVMGYRDVDRDITKIGSELDVETILEGSIQKDSNRIRVRAQLVGVQDDSHIWSQTYDREITGIFEVQDDISNSIAEILRIRLLGEARTSAKHRQTNDLEAYNYYVQGRYLWNKRTEESLHSSIEYFERAIERDSGYALAYSGLADAWSVLPDHSDLTMEDVFDQSREAAETALRLDDDLAEAHASMGLVLRHKDPGKSEKEFLKAIALNPGYAYAHYWYSLLLADMGKAQESMGELELSYELNPLSIVTLINLASKRMGDGDAIAAEELFERAVRIEPARPISRYLYADFLQKTGRIGAAIEQLHEVLARDSTYGSAYNRLAYIHSHLGDLDSALWYVGKYMEVRPDHANPWDSRGDILLHNGRFEDALANYSRALEIDSMLMETIQDVAKADMFMGDFDAVDSIIDRVSAIPDPEVQAIVSTGRAIIFLFRGMIGNALEELDRGMKADSMASNLPGLIDKLYLRSQVYCELGDTGLAMQGFEEAVEMSERLGHWGFHGCDKIERVRYLAMDGQYEQALQLAEESRDCWERANPHLTAEYWRALGIIELARGNYETAIELMERTVNAYNPLTPIGWFHLRYWLAYAYIRIERYSNAVEVLRSMLSTYTGERIAYPIWDAKARYWLALALENEGRIDESIEAYKDLLAHWASEDSTFTWVQDARTRLRSLENVP